MTPTTVTEIQEKIDKNAEEEFIIKNVPELLFWELGLECIGGDT